MLSAIYLLVVLAGALGVSAKKTTATVVSTVTVSGAVTSLSTNTVTVTYTPSDTQLPPVTSTETNTVVVTFTAPTTMVSTLFVTYTEPPVPTTTTYTTNLPPSILTTVQLVTVITTAAPLPTATFYQYLCRDRVTCPSGTNSAGSKTCLDTYYQGIRTSTTCTASNCCTPKATTIPTTTETRLYNCLAARVTCPQFSVLLTDKQGASVPCVMTYVNGKLSSSTCVPGTCCSKVKLNKKVPCNQVIKCVTYKVDPSTMQIQTCRTNKKNANVCTVKKCCGTA